MTPCKICGNESVMQDIDMCYACLTKNAAITRIDKGFALRHLYYRLRHEINSYHFIAGYSAGIVRNGAGEVGSTKAEEDLKKAFHKLECLIGYQWEFYRICKEVEEDVDEPGTTLGALYSHRDEIEKQLGRKIF